MLKQTVILHKLISLWFINTKLQFINLHNRYIFTYCFNLTYFQISIKLCSQNVHEKQILANTVVEAFPRTKPMFSGLRWKRDFQGKHVRYKNVLTCRVTLV